MQAALVRLAARRMIPGASFTRPLVGRALNRRDVPAQGSCTSANSRFVKPVKMLAVRCAHKLQFQKERLYMHDRTTASGGNQDETKGRFDCRWLVAHSCLPGLATVETQAASSGKGLSDPDSFQPLSIKLAEHPKNWCAHEAHECQRHSHSFIWRRTCLLGQKRPAAVNLPQFIRLISSLTIASICDAYAPHMAVAPKPISL